MKTYKVWICIEECDEENDEYQEMDAPGAEMATFESYEEAWKYASKIVPPEEEK